jgi:hypothetical protein
MQAKMIAFGALACALPQKELLLDEVKLKIN